MPTIQVDLPRTLARILLCGLLTIPLCRAQLTTTASIAGTVIDDTGAVVSGATVTIVDEDTKATTTAQTNDSGKFIAPTLIVGTYSVSVSKAGFETYKESGIVLHPATVATVNATLKIGAVGTQISVSATVAQVQTTTSENSNEVAETQVNTLPINGRNYQALAVVMPGVVNTSSGSALGTGGRATNNVLSINGLGANTTFYALDGIWNENTGNMAQTTITPNPDTLEEVRVLQNNYSPKYSLMGSSVVLLQTKSGNSQYHGTLFEYLRNDDLNARNFFSPTVPVLKQNIFGYNIGGPIFIPKVYNTSRQRTFFFFNQSWVISHAGNVLRGQTPTANERGGIFPTVVNMPGTTTPFPTNAQGQYVIPSNLLNPNSVAYLNALYSQPNAAGTLNYVNLKPQITDQRDDEIKVDHNFTDRMRLTGEYLDEHQTLIQNSLNQSNAGSIFPTNYENDLTQNRLAQLQFNATLSPSMVNTAAISLNIYDLYLNLDGTVYTNQVPNFQENLPLSGLLSNRLPLVTISQGWAPEGVAAARPLFHAADLDETASDNWSWLRGKHFIEAGVSVVLSTKRQNVATQSNGAFTFTGQFTGNALADFLLGDAATFTQQSSERRVYVHGPIVSPYVQDRIQLTRNVTVTVGARVLYMPLPHGQTDFESLFAPGAYNPSEAPTVNSNGTITTTPNYNPSNGLLFNGVNGVPVNWSGNHNWYIAPMAGFAWDIFGNGKTALRGGYALTYTRIFTNQDCSFTCAANPPFVASTNLNTPNFPNPAGTGVVKAATAPTLSTADLNIEATQSHTYSLSLEHQFPSNWTVAVTGAGALARHLPGTWNFNQPLPDGPYNFNPIINSGSVFTYLYGPYQGYGAINDLNTEINSNWNALEVAVRHPVSDKLYVSAAYTWSHNLTDSVVDIYHPSAYYGNSTLNEPQVLTFSAVWTIPWLQHAQGLKGTVLGGWKYSDITTIRSGLSFNPGLSIAKQGIAVRPNVIGSSLSGPGTVAEFFNTQDFGAPAPGFFGNAGSGVILGPGLVDFDMALYKDFRVTEHSAVEFRAELFNTFNHPNFIGISTNYGNSSFGQLTSAADPRIAEFALRYQF